MIKLSTGQDSTLGNWISLCKTFFGEDSASIDFLEGKAKESRNGLEEEVIAEERQLIQALYKIHSDGVVGEKEVPE